MKQDNEIFIKDLINNNYNFIIPNYQRGYKWSDCNINALLNDIENISDLNHCLHNLTIIKNNNNIEVIDGQQRLTTIFLLLSYLNNNKNYSLNYQIREETKYFLDNELYSTIEKIKKMNKDTKNIDSLFESIKNTEIILKTRKSNYNKQDIYFICNALFAINKWFNHHNNKEYIYNNLIEKTFFYKNDLTNTGLTGETIFANLNSGKVDLTQIDLIKADLIINISNNMVGNNNNNNDVLINETRSNIGRLWDEIEIFLAQDKVWYWIIKNKIYTNKIRLLFNIILDNKEDIEKDLYNQFVYEIKEKSYEDVLFRLKDYFYMIKNWYYDNDFYHLVGISISIGININELISIYYNKDIKDKLAIKNQIKKLIIENIGLNIINENNQELLYVDDYSYENLNFLDSKEKINKILLLLNCLEGYKDDKFEESFKYRFDLHNKEKWSIEHILPQKPKNKDYLISYFIELISYLKDLDNYDFSLYGVFQNIIEEVKEYDVEENINEIIKKYINIEHDYDSIIKYINELGFIHSIGNLLLLERNINSSLSNELFSTKRDTLLKIIMNKNIFVPPLSLKVYSKNFDGADREKKYWTIDDYNNYLNYQENQLKKFIKSIKE